jgi:hypothetical protein
MNLSTHHGEANLNRSNRMAAFNLHFESRVPFHSICLSACLVFSLIPSVFGLRKTPPESPRDSGRGDRERERVDAHATSLAKPVMRDGNVATVCSARF